MEIIPVLDLAGGMAVHARGGDRARYRPVESVLTPGRPGDPLALVQAYRNTLGARECYLADLDAIQGGAPQRAEISALAEVAGALLVDAGVASAEPARDLVAAGASSVIVGLETLRALGDLAAVVGAIGTARTAFSLDLRGGRPLLHPAARHATPEDPVALAEAAATAGATTIVVLDLGRVGAGGGVDLDLVDALRRRLPGVRLMAGGGVRDRDDLERLRDVGCDGALVGSALHAGRIGAADLAALAPAGRDQSGASASR